MRFLIDAQLPPSLAQWLRENGREAEHVEDCGLRHGDDAGIWQYALQASAVIVTKDEDFVERAAHANVAPVVVWLRIGNAANRTLRAWLVPKLPQIVELITQGHRLVEVN